MAVCGVGLWWASKNWVPTLEVARRSMPPFEVRLEQGHLSTTLPEPFVVSDADFTLIVDTSGKELDARAYEKAILITKTKAIVKKNSFETREYDLSAAPDFRVTTDDLIDWLTTHKTAILWTLFTTLGLAVVPLAWLFFIPILFFLALLLMIPAKILGTRLRYGQVLSIAFYAVTLPTLVQTVLWAQGITGSGFFWGIFLGWAVLGVAVCRGVVDAGSGGDANLGLISSAPPPPPAYKS